MDVGVAQACMRRGGDSYKADLEAGRSYVSNVQSLCGGTRVGHA